MLFDFVSSDDDPAANWRSVDDVIMGGVSESRFEKTEEGAAFAGDVSLEQGGGFASVRSPADEWDVSGCDTFALRVRGDGKRYWLTTYTESGPDVSYRARLEPSSSWAVVRVPFRSLRPYRRGEPVPDARPFDPSRLRAIGFLIADKQDGPFRLEVQWIRAQQNTESIRHTPPSGAREHDH